MNLISRCLVLAMFTVAISIVLLPHYYHGQLNGNHSLHLSIRSLKGKGSDNGGNKRQLNGDDSLHFSISSLKGKGSGNGGNKGQLNGNDSLHFSIRTLKGKGGGNGGNTGGGNGTGKGNGNGSGGKPPCTEECTDENTVSGVFICRPKGKSGKWSTQVSTTSKE
mmetsp:Transcript_21590/g.35406  ORF Transcript_21590/g.35406 Transcript_21590/m.35406 type:complete len:164 (-) Transcript_21590:727-1218(-)